MVFQSYALFPHMTVSENVQYGLRFSGFAKKEVAGRANAGLELVGLTGFGDRLPSQLSGGQQQRVAVARALVLEPQVLLFDEPLSNLDAKLRRHVREEIREIQTKLGLTVVYVTHDQEEALAVSDRIIVMNNAVDRAGRHAARALRRAGQHVRRRFHRRGQYLRLRGRVGRERHGDRAARAAGAEHCRRAAAVRGRRSLRRGRAASISACRRRRRRCPASSKRSPMSAAISNSSSGRNSARFSWFRPTSTRRFTAGQTVGIGFPDEGPVLITG